jgi:hypothetical protein
MNEIDRYVEKQKSPQKEICRRLRKIIADTLRSVKEEMKWGVPSFGGGAFYVVALKDHVNLGFASKGLTKEELKLFDGGGKTTRHVEIRSLQLDRERIVKLIRLVNEKQK